MKVVHILYTASTIYDILIHFFRAILNVDFNVHYLVHFVYYGPTLLPSSQTDDTLRGAAARALSSW